LGPIPGTSIVCSGSSTTLALFRRDAILRSCVCLVRQAPISRSSVSPSSDGNDTVIALTDVLMRANWAKRILFLADRVALVKQAANEYKKQLPGVSPVNLVTERDQEGRVYICTYPTMMGLIDEMNDGVRRFGPGHFDLIIVDEAHRSLYQKYGAIFRYFDALLVGLTATSRDEIDRNTYGLFALERGVPTDEYGLNDAVSDGFLVPSENIAVPLKFPREGIRYDDLSDEEKEQWDALEWNEEGEVDVVAR